MALPIALSVPILTFTTLVTIFEMMLTVTGYDPYSILALIKDPSFVIAILQSEQQNVSSVSRQQVVASVSGPKELSEAESIALEEEYQKQLLTFSSHAESCIKIYQKCIEESKMGHSAAMQRLKADPSYRECIDSEPLAAILENYLYRSSAINNAECSFTLEKISQSPTKTDFIILEKLAKVGHQTYQGVPASTTVYHAESFANYHINYRKVNHPSFGESLVKPRDYQDPLTKAKYPTHYVFHRYQQINGHPLCYELCTLMKEFNTEKAKLSCVQTIQPQTTHSVTVPNRNAFFSTEDNLAADDAVLAQTLGMQIDELRAARREQARQDQATMNLDRGFNHLSYPDPINIIPGFYH